MIHEPARRTRRHALVLLTTLASACGVVNVACSSTESTEAGSSPDGGGAVLPDAESALADASSPDASLSLDASTSPDAAPACSSEVVIATDTAVTTDRTYPAGVCLRFLPGGRLTIAAGVKVTILGPVIADLVPLFPGEGAVDIVDAQAQWFGAKGDGVTDDSAALARAVASARLLRLQGNFALDHLVVPDGRVLQGQAGGRLVATVENVTVLSVGSDSSVRDLIVDGAAHKDIGILVRPAAARVEIARSTVRSLRGPVNGYGAYGIWVNDGAKDVNILKTTVRDISGGSDGIIGNGIGANRGIMISGVVTRLVVEACTIEQIGDFEDGDAIQVQAGGSRPFPVSDVTIRGCTVRAFMKRAIKLMSSGATVENNVIVSDYAGAGDAAAFAGIEMWDVGHVVRGNKVTLARAMFGIGGDFHDSVVEGNVISVDAADLYPDVRGSWGMYGIRGAPANNVRFVGNTIHNNRTRPAFYFNNGDGQCTIQNNIFVDKANCAAAIDSTGTQTVSGNTCVP